MEAATKIADAHLAEASRIIAAARAGPSPIVRSFLDADSFTLTHVVSDPATGKAAIIDSVLDFDPASGRTSHASADRIVQYVLDGGLEVEWLLETHVHADHLSAAPYLQEKLGGTLAIGRHITEVQATFATIFNEGPRFARDGSQFDRLFDDGDRFAIGSIEAIALHVPGHTPADMAFVIGGAVFTGDTLFMPDYGTARGDYTAVTICIRASG
jgi:glyoxylase-like metal-dependent hydrolase (beta-lactamase superfamily II)